MGRVYDQNLELQIRSRDLILSLVGISCGQHTTPPIQWDATLTIDGRDFDVKITEQGRERHGKGLPTEDA